MDVERTMEFILAQQAKAEASNGQWAKRRAAADGRQARNERQLAEIQKVVVTAMKLMTELEQGNGRH